LTTPGRGNTNLLGITRDTHMKQRPEMRLKDTESSLSREQLYMADEVFAVGTAAEVTPIRSLDKIQIGSGSRGPVTEKLQKRYLDLVQGRGEDKWGFITRVQ
jgi:branched-chain amino acid aminotransferase